MADHVNLGLIPTSEAGWPVACAALRSDTGGWLHVHGNVTSGLTSNAQMVTALLSTQTPFSTKTEDFREKSHQSSVNDKASNSGQTSLLKAVANNKKSSDSKSKSVEENSHLQGASALLVEAPAQEQQESRFSVVHAIETSSNCDLSHSSMNQAPSCNRKIKPEWLDWAKYVAQSVLQHLKKSHDNDNWNVQIQHIEHVKSYAPHIDHVVLDVECRPL